MTWTLGTLTWPQTAATLQTQAESVLSGLPVVDDEAVDRLQAISGRAQWARHSLSEQAAGLAGLRDQLDALLLQATVLTVTPWQHGVGLQEDGGHFLAPANAVKRLAVKLIDHADRHRPEGELHAMGLMLTATTTAGLADLLQTVTAVLPVPEWCAACRRLQADNQLMTQPAAAMVPRWQPAAPLALEPLRSYRTHQGAELAQLESLAADAASPLAKLQALAAKRAARLNELAEALYALKAVSGDIWRLTAQGRADEIAGQLNGGEPDYSHVHTVATLILSPSPLTFLKELIP